MSISINDLDSQIVTIPFTIPNGGSLSGIVDCMGFIPFAVVTPSAWTAATLTLQGSIDGSIFMALSGASGTQLQMLSAVVASIIQSIPSLTTGGLGAAWTRWLKFRSGTDVAPVNQAADRVFTLLLKPDANRKP